MQPAESATDRERHCPFLLRVFCSAGAHDRREVFEEMEDAPIVSELHIYMWPDATLREIADLAQDANADARKPSVRLGFSVVSEGRDGRVEMRNAGWVQNGRRKSADEDKTLSSLRLQPDDLLDVALVQ